MGAYRTCTGTHVVPGTDTFCKLEYPCFRGVYFGSFKPLVLYLNCLYTHLNILYGLIEFKFMSRAFVTHWCCYVLPFGVVLFYLDEVYVNPNHTKKIHPRTKFKKKNLYIRKSDLA